MRDVGTVMEQMKGFGSMEEYPVKGLVHPNCKMYTREIFMPAGMMVVSKVHNDWSVNILASGRLLLLNDPLEDYVELVGPQVFETGPGSQKLLKMLTDCVFMEVYNLRDGETEEDIRNRVTGGETNVE